MDFRQPASDTDAPMVLTALARVTQWMNAHPENMVAARLMSDIVGDIYYKMEGYHDL